MGSLIALTLILVAVSFGVAILLKYFVKTEKGKYIALLIAGIVTVLVHYSSIPYHLIVDGECETFLRSNPNLIIPVYPCNVTMICCFLYGLKKNKDDSFAHYLADYCFFFGAVSSIIGMACNFFFADNPTLADYDTTKGIIAHGTMFCNAIMLAFFGKIKIDLPKNMLRFTIAIVMMLMVGLHVSLIYWFVGGGKEAMISVNSMFLFKSIFDGADFITFPFVALLAWIVMLIVLVIAEFIEYRKDMSNIWYRRLFKKRSKINNKN